MVVAQAVVHRTTDREVPGSNPAGSWAIRSTKNIKAIIGACAARSSVMFDISRTLKVGKNCFAKA